MNYFKNIRSFADLKKQYRTLAIANHPDKGGSTATMQQINLEFEKLYKIWEHRKDADDTVTGYEKDFDGASAREYTEYVKREYKWWGENYKGQSKDEITKLIRKWLKDTYPDYKFSVTQNGYKSIHIHLMEADFNPFLPGVNKVSKGLNHHWIDEDEEITERMKEVANNIKSFAMSYNIDDTDSMVDYFFTNFYLDIQVGSWKKPFKQIIPKSRRTTGNAPPEFKHPEGKTHKSIRQALNGACFCFPSNGTQRNILCTSYVSEDGTKRYYGLIYSSDKVAQKRIDKLLSAGIRARLTGYRRGYIEFLGYTEDTQAAIEKEREDYQRAYLEWKQQN